jgi:hypothetical protein
MSSQVDLEESLAIKAVLSSTRIKLAQQIVMIADLEGLLALEREKNKELTELLKTTGTGS